jgi:protease I
MARKLDGKKVAILVTDGFEQVEMTKPRKALDEAGADTKIVSPKSGRIQGMHHADKGDKFDVDLTLEETPPEDFDALLIPGGTSPDRIRMDREVHRFVREFDALKKPMFSIGHGAQVLISSQLVRGRQITGVHSIADDIRNAGGLYRDQPTVTDSNWVSTRGGDDLSQFNRAMLEKLASAIPVQPVV